MLPHSDGVQFPPSRKRTFFHGIDYMQSAPPTLSERARLDALLRYDILDTDFEASYDELTELASSICDAPIALISLIDSSRQWFKSNRGLPFRETSRDIAFCSHAILQNDVFVVNDTLEDQRFFDNPLVLTAPNIRFYAGAPLHTPDGHALGTLCVLDVVPRALTSGQRKALQVLSQQVLNQLELRQSYRQLQDYAAKLKESNATKDKFLSIISHDLKDPFTGIVGFSDLLRKNAHCRSNDGSLHMAENVHRSAVAALGLLENLLRWAMSETDRIEHKPTLLALTPLVEQVCELESGVAQKKHLAITVDVPAGTVVFADPTMLASVLQNLLSNAIKFTPAFGSIHVTARVVAAEVELRVIDGGVGISDAKLAQLFCPGQFSSSKGTEGEVGTGLGLLLCKQFVEKNGGQLSLNAGSNNGGSGGTTARFTVPRYAP